MDARQRLNQLRKQKTKLKRNKFNSNPNKNNKKLNSLTDLRELIPKPVVNKFTNNNNSVKNRIGFITKKKRLAQKQALIAANTKNKQNLKLNQKKKRVRISFSGEDERIPKVMVKLSKVEDNSVLRLKNKFNSRPNQGINTLQLNRNLNERNDELNESYNTVFTTRPFVSSQFVSQTSVPNYMTSFATNNRFSNSTNNTFNEIKSKNNAVLVSNLCQTITMQDINELFGEIGPLVKSSKISPSVALVVYEDEQNARYACQTYHNRLLDGQPMHCIISSQSRSAYTTDSPLRTQTSQSSRLLASQLKQINSSSFESQSTRMTAAQAFTNRGVPKVRFTVNI